MWHLKRVFLICVVVQLVEGQHASSKEFWACSAIHCTLDRLQAIDLAFRLAVAKRQFDCVVDGVNVTTQNSGEPRDRDETRVLNPDAEQE
jgi:hypothetical protein